MKKYILTEDQLEDLLSDSLNMDYVFNQDPSSTLSALNRYDNEERGEDIRICLGDYEVYQEDVNKPDWANAPDWANYLAMDKDGAWSWYEKKPTKSEYESWAWDTPFGNIKEVTPSRDEWEGSLEARPNKTNTEKEV